MVALAKDDHLTPAYLGERAPACFGDKVRICLRKRTLA